MSLRWKFAAALAATAGVIAILACAGAYVTATRQLDDTLDDALVQQATAAVARAAERGPGRGLPERLPDVPAGAVRCPDAAALRSLISAQLIIDDDVITCFEGGGEIAVTPADVAIADGTDMGDPDGDGDLDYRLRTGTVDGESARVITVALPQGGALQLARATGERSEVLSGLSARLAVIAAAAIALAALVGFWLATLMVRPIRRLTATAHHIAATRDLTTVVPAGGSDEIGSLASSFTTMVGSLAESQEQQQRLISDASHEMRTPLTSLRTNLELLARAEASTTAELPEADRRAVIEDLRFETGELTALLTELVELATDRSDAGESPEPTDLADIGRAIAERAERRTGREVRVETDGQATVVSARPHAIERALSNLVDNAVKYSPEGSAIEVSIGTHSTDGSTGDRLRVAVRDHGPGIAAEDRPRVFDRFYRATSARTEPGSGLGLAIVSQIVTSHRGEVFVADAPEGGAIVGFTLPTS